MRPLNVEVLISEVGRADDSVWTQLPLAIVVIESSYLYCPLLPLLFISGKSTDIMDVAIHTQFVYYSMRVGLVIQSKTEQLDNAQQFTHVSSYLTLTALGCSWRL